MRITVLTQYFWPEEFKINDLALGLRDRGHDVSVLTGLPNYPAGKLFPGYRLNGPLRQCWNDIDIIRTPLWPRRQAGALDLSANYLSFALSACLRAPKLAGTSDLLFVYQPSPVTVGLPAALFKRGWDVPVVFWVQDIWPDSLAAAGGIRSRRLLEGVGRFTGWIYRHCDLILAGSRGFLPRLKAMIPGTAKLDYFPQWPESLYRPVTPNERPDIAAQMPSGFTLLFAGNIGEAQSFETILDAATILRDHPLIRWVIVGDGRRRLWVEDEIRARGLTNMTLLGRAPAADMPHYFASAGALLVTLAKRDLFAITMPSKLPSYLACGRPILAAADGEVAGIVQEAGAGYTAPAEDAPALAAAAVRLAELSPEERASMGERGRLYCAEHFDRERLLARLDEHCRDLVRKR